MPDNQPARFLSHPLNLTWLYIRQVAIDIVDFILSFIIFLLTLGVNL